MKPIKKRGQLRKYLTQKITQFMKMNQGEKVDRTRSIDIMNTNTTNSSMDFTREVIHNLDESQKNNLKVILITVACSDKIAEKWEDLYSEIVDQLDTLNEYGP